MLTVIRVGRAEELDPYLSDIREAVSNANTQMKLVELTGYTTVAQLIAAIGNAESEPNCNAIMVLRPLPKTFKTLEEHIMCHIPYDRDIAGANPNSLIFSLNAAGIMQYLITQGVNNVSGMNIAVFGDATKNPIKDIVHIMGRAGATVTIMSETAEEQMRFLACRTADIIISKIDVPDIVNKEYINDFSRPKILIDLSGKDISTEAKNFIRMNSNYPNPVPNADDIRRGIVAELVWRLEEVEGNG